MSEWVTAGKSLQVVGFATATTKHYDTINIVASKSMQYICSLLLYVRYNDWFSTSLRSHFTSCCHEVRRTRKISFLFLFYCACHALQRRSLTTIPDGRKPGEEGGGNIIVSVPLQVRLHCTRYYWYYWHYHYISASALLAGVMHEGVACLLQRAAACCKLGWERRIYVVATRVYI